MDRRLALAIAVSAAALFALTAVFGTLTALVTYGIVYVGACIVVWVVRRTR